LVSAASVAFNLNLTVGQAAPDGTNRQVYLVNGQTPGPSLACDQGDEVTFVINNNLDVETTIHFHGIEQKGTNWADGVPGITQRLIAPGHSFNATWTATEHGSYWYHAHSRAIYGDGVRGSLFIRPSQDELNTSPFSQISSNQSDIDAMKAAHNNPKILSIQDWTFWTSDEGLQLWNDTRTELLCIDSVLINGKGRKICPNANTFTPYVTNNPVVPEVTAKGCALPTNNLIQPFDDKQPQLLNSSYFFDCQNTTTPLEVIQVNASAHWASIAIINMAALWDFRVSIDDHPLWVYAADGQYHDAQQVNVVNIPPGERFQVMIKLDKPAGDYAIRVSASITPQFISGYAVLSYGPTNTTGTVIPPAVNQALGYGGDTLSGYTELDPITLKAFPSSLLPPQNANVTLIFDLYRLTSLTWALNSDPFAPFLELGDPILYDPSVASALDSDLIKASTVASSSEPSKANSLASLTLLVQLSTSFWSPIQETPRHHPLHKHGVKAWIIGIGNGAWNWTTVAEAQQAQPNSFNLGRAPRRDGFHTADHVPDEGWLVIRYEVTEPGAIFFHCHINIHTFGGMAVALLEGDVSTLQIPQAYVDWNNQAAQGQGHRKIRRAIEHSPNGAVAGSHLARIVRSNE
ncbi:hypothetical protein FRB99_007839, partial [Tulasnella sp. 403]